MQQQYNSNHQPKKLDLNPKEQITNQSLGELNSIFLEKAFVSQDLPELVCPQRESRFVPKNALYITEVDDHFYFLDRRADEENDQTKAISSNDLALSSALSPVANKADLSSSKAIGNTAKTSVFLGKKGLLMGVGLGALLTLGATRILFAPTASNQKESELTEVAASNIPAQAVTIAEVKATDINSTLDASGTVTAFESTPVMSQAAGLQITEILTERGDLVERGQVLARLNNKALIAQKIEAEAAVLQEQSALEELQAGSRAEEVAQAEARVASAESALVEAESDLDLVQKRVERNRNLQTEGAITRDRFDDILNQEKVAQSDLLGAKANLKEAQSALAQVRAGSRRQTIAQGEARLKQAQGRLQGIEAQLEDTIIVAPSSGIISAREARVGQTTSTSEMLFSIIQNGRLELRLQVPETLVGKIQPGQKVRVTSNSDRNLQLTGEVREINPTIDDTSRQALVKVDLPSNANLKPGMFLRAAINTDTSQGLAVPIESLLPQSRNNATAFVLEQDNTVKAKTVEMGEILDSQQVEVVNGLEPGDRLILKGAAYLKDGDTVKVIENQL